MLELESAASPSGEPPSLSERVLVVEDDRATRLGLTELVRSWGYVAESAADGEEALQRITTFRPGIIVSDVVMPRMGQLEEALPPFDRARERAFLVAEDLALEQRLGNRGAVDRDERKRGTRAGLVDVSSAQRALCRCRIHRD